MRNIATRPDGETRYRTDDRFDPQWNVTATITAAPAVVTVPSAGTKWRRSTGRNRRSIAVASSGVIVTDDEADDDV